MGRLGHLAMACLVMGLGGLTVFGASRHPYYTEFGPDAGFFPMWLGLAETLLGIALVTQALRRAPQPAGRHASGSRRQLIAGGLFVVYVALLDVLGFTIATALFLLAVIIGVEPRPWKEAVGVSIGLSLGLLALFGWAFGIPLPEGPYGF